jgi:hypothetical protein
MVVTTRYVVHFDHILRLESQNEIFSVEIFLLIRIESNSHLFLLS